MTSLDSLSVRRILNVGSKSYAYFSLKAAETELGPLARLPICLKILLENLLRFEDGVNVTLDDVRALAARTKPHQHGMEISFRPSRLLMEDCAAIPALADLAALRNVLTSSGRDASLAGPACPVDLVIAPQALPAPLKERDDRSVFLQWCQKAFDGLHVATPGTGPSSIANMERLAFVVARDGSQETRFPLVYPDTFVSTGGGATMINGLGVLGWSVGGLSAEAVLLGQPITLTVPEVVGIRLSGSLCEGLTVTELVLALASLLRKRNKEAKLVEFFGPGIDSLSLAERAIIAALAPEYGATCALFPIDADTIQYLRLTNRPPGHIDLVEAYAKEQGLWREKGEDNAARDPTFTASLNLDLGSVPPPVPPKRHGPQNEPAAQASLERTGSFEVSPVPAPYGMFQTFAWDDNSLTLRRPPYINSFPSQAMQTKDIADARLLAIFGDSIPADWLAPTGPVAPGGPAGKYLADQGLPAGSFGAYPAFNGNHEVVARAAFSHERLVNELGGCKGGLTKHQPSGALLPIFDAAMRYKLEKTPVIVIAGKNYGHGVSHNEAAKGTKLLGVAAVIAESFAPRHRADLISMGVLPLTLKSRLTRADLKITGSETFSLLGLADLQPHHEIMLAIARNGEVDRYMLHCCIDTADEAAYYKNGGLLPFVLRSLLRKDEE